MTIFNVLINNFMNNFMMKISKLYQKKREIESEEVNFKVTKAIHFLSSYTFYFV